MAANQFQAPQLAPDLLRKQFQLQNNQALAQQLMQSQAPQGQMVSGHYVAPSWTQQLASALNPVVGRQIMDKMPEQMADLQRGQQDYDRQRFAALTGGGQGNAFAAQDPQREFLIANLMGLDKYAAEKLKQSAPTSEQKNLGFLPPDQRNAAIAAPFINEMGKDGVQNVLGPNGQVQAFAVPGYQAIQAGNAGAVAGAQESAKAGLDIVKVDRGDGTLVDMTRDQYADYLKGRGSTEQTAVPGTAADGGFGTTPPKAKLDARAELPTVISQIDQIENTINSIVSHPGLESGTGLQSYLPSVTGKARDFDALTEQLQGQVFLQAYESLKGGGVITDFEGAKAEKALARAQTSQTKEAYVNAMNEFLGVIQTAKRRAYEKAGAAAPAQAANPQASQATSSYDRESLMAEARRRGLIK